MVPDGQDPTYDDVHSNLPLLHAVVKETLRLYPSVPKACGARLFLDTHTEQRTGRQGGDERRCASRRHARAQGLDCGISAVGDGTSGAVRCFMTGYCWCSRERSLWPNAETFDPDRWLTNEPEPSAFKFIAFNAGLLHDRGVVGADV